jgi:lipopolysaccharide export system ATP-binding protein
MVEGGREIGWKKRDVGKIEAINLVKKYRRNSVVDEVSITVNTGEVIGLLGPNGAGKTTAFSIIAGLIKPDKGFIMLNGEDITHLPVHIRGRKGISYLPQEPSIFRRLSVEDNIRAILEIVHSPKNEIDSKLHELLDELNISHIAKKQATAISGGERRRVEITRTLATNPSFILFDEPFAGIDPISITELQRIIVRLKTREIGILLADHNVRDALSVVDRAYVIRKGKVIASGSPENIIRHELAKEVFFGEDFSV